MILEDQRGNARGRDREEWKVLRLACRTRESERKITTTRNSRELYFRSAVDGSGRRRGKEEISVEVQCKNLWSRFLDTFILEGQRECSGGGRRGDRRDRLRLPCLTTLRFGTEDYTTWAVTRQLALRCLSEWEVCGGRGTGRDRG